jgi:hypothetical protein
MKCVINVAYPGHIDVLRHSNYVSRNKKEDIMEIKLIYVIEKYKNCAIDEQKIKFVTLNNKRLD